MIGNTDFIKHLIFFFLFAIEKIVERRVEVAAPQRYIQTYQQPANNFDYRKFFDFGFFSNLGATYGGAPQPSNNGHVINVQKQLSPNTLLLHKTVIPASQPQQVHCQFIDVV